MGLEACVYVSSNTASETLSGPPLNNQVAVWTASAGGIFSFTLDAPAKDVPYRVMWDFQDQASFSTRLGGLRMACYNFLVARGMPGLAVRFVPRVHTHYIPSTEIKE